MFVIVVDGKMEENQGYVKNEKISCPKKYAQCLHHCYIIFHPLYEDPGWQISLLILSAWGT